MTALTETEQAYLTGREKQKCAAPDCKVMFVPVNAWHVYHAPRCKNRIAARERAAKIKALLAKEETQ